MAYPFQCDSRIFGSALLIGTDQGREVTAGIHDASNWQFIYLIFAVLWLSIQSWYWARVQIARAKAGSDNRNLNQSELVKHLRNVVPRIYAIVVFAAAVAALAFSYHWKSAWIMSLIGFITVWLLVKRRPLIEQFAESREWFGRMAVQPSNFKFGDRIPVLGIITLSLSIVLAVASLILIANYPLEIGQRIGASPIAFFAFGCLIPFGSVAVIASRKYGLPFIGALLVFAVASSWTNDNHDIKRMDEVKFQPANKIQFSAAMRKWADANGPERKNVSAEKAIPIVFVSTAGGGLRAAYWTATVLGAIQDQCEQFYNSTFSISAVSGGSVGTSMFAARMAQHPPVALLTDSEPGCTKPKQPISPLLQSALSKDFLGPTVASMLFPDLVQRFWPIPFVQSRGKVLAASWALGWEEACKTDPTCSVTSGIPSLDSPFSEFGPRVNSPGWKPILLLNSTHQETGKRIITSHIQATRNIFFDAFDFHHLLDSEVSLASAALNSARFTFVSPPGLIKNKSGKVYGHALDGGYFENSGAVTSAEAILNFIEALPKLGVKIRPIVIQITSDPDLKKRDFAASSNAAEFLEVNESPHRFINELAGPLRGILKTRSARGILAGKTLAELEAFLNVDVVDSASNKTVSRFPLVEDAVFVNFEMCIDALEKLEERWFGDNHPSLGWTMTDKSREYIRQLLSVRYSGDEKGKCNNAKSLERVVNALRE